MQAALLLPVTESGYTGIWGYMVANMETHMEKTLETN